MTTSTIHPSIKTKTTVAVNEWVTMSEKIDGMMTGVIEMMMLSGRMCMYVLWFGKRNIKEGLETSCFGDGELLVQVLRRSVLVEWMYLLV